MRDAILFLARAPLARVYGGPAWLRWGLRAAFYASIAVLPLALVWPWVAVPGLLWAGLTVWQVSPPATRSPPH